MEKKTVIKENWGKLSLLELVDILEINLEQLLEIAFELQLFRKTTPNISRTWTKFEDDFLTNHSNKLNVRDASNLLYRSHYATYQRVRFLGLKEMIKK